MALIAQSVAQTILHSVDLFGTAAFAVSGALRAVEKRPDFVGMLILATATAVGGGVIRDLVLDRPVVFLQDWGYPLVILLATVAVFSFPVAFLRRERILLYFDAIGLGVFTAISASVCWDTQTVTPLSILYLAVICGCAGGTIRDLLIGRTSLVLLNELYVTPAAFGAAALMLARSLRLDHSASLALAFLVTTTFRCLAIHYHWTLPRLLEVKTAPPVLSIDIDSNRDVQHPLTEKHP